jgi:ABC-type cobalamin/Fe3+-siderophores transport system ATPase subunit
MKALLEVKNYRCFSDEAPLKLPLGLAAVAFVGPNNSGKSAALRILHELRSFWSHLTTSRNPQLFVGNPVPIGLPLQDAALDDVFHDGNDRDIEILIRAEDDADRTADPVKAHLFKFRCYRQTRHMMGEVYTANDKKLGDVASVDAERGHLVSSTGELVDARWFFALVRHLISALYLAPFRSVYHQATEQHEDFLTGTRLVERWRELKVGGARQNTLTALEAERVIADIFGFRSLQIDATVKNDLQLIIEGKPYRLRDVGHGVAQFVIAVINFLYLKPSIVLLDEPETGLHPAMQLKYLALIGEVTKGCVYFATHSVGLARAVADEIFALRRVDGRSEAKPLDTVRNYNEFVGELSFSTWREMGGRAILLVEGVTDVRAVTALLRKLKKDLEIVVLPMGGRELIKAGTGREIAELKRLHTNVYVLIDSERRSSAEALAPQRAQFVDDCRQFGIEVCILERRAIENYWPEPAIKRAVAGATRGLDEYEEIRSANCGWSKRDNWRIAAATDIQELEGTDLLNFLKRI